MRDRELIKRVCAQHPGAFDELYYAYVDRVHRQLHAIVGPQADLEDLVQQTFVQVYRNIDSFRQDSAFSTWLHRVAVNVAFSHLRSVSRWRRNETEGELQLSPLEEAPERPDEALSRKENRLALYAALDRLKVKKRIVFVLYEIEGMTLEEIAQTVEAPLNTVAARLRAARMELRRALERNLKKNPTAAA